MICMVGWGHHCHDGTLTVHPFQKINSDSCPGMTFHSCRIGFQQIYQNRPELLFLTVATMPNASGTRLGSKTYCSAILPFTPGFPLKYAGYLMSILIIPVLPTPFPPLTKVELLFSLNCSFPSFIIALLATSTTANT